LLPDYFLILGKADCTHREQLYALCIFDETLEFCSDPIFNRAMPELVNIFIKIALASANKKDVQ